MAEIHIVLENPQNGPPKEHKKRPRLVTSCDNCRMKKLRCIKPDGPTVRCEACAHANIPCEFRDREQYLAERSRIAKSISPTGGTSPANFVLNPHHHHHPYHGAKRPRTEYPALPVASSSSQSTGYPVNWAPAAPQPSPHQFYTPSHHPTNVNIYTLAIPEELHPPLFDPKCRERPNPLYMVSFIDAFFKYSGDSFPFLYYDEIVRLFFQDDLSYILATCIAAWAVRYSSIPEFSKTDGRSVSLKYVNHAKNLLASIAYNPNLPNLHSLIILAWLTSDQVNEFCAYAKMAEAMLQDLQHERNGELISSTDQKILDGTWSSVNHLVAAANKLG